MRQQSHPTRSSCCPHCAPQKSLQRKRPTRCPLHARFALQTLAPLWSGCRQRLGWSCASRPPPQSPTTAAAPSPTLAASCWTLCCRSSTLSAWPDEPCRGTEGAARQALPRWYPLHPLPTMSQHPRRCLFLSWLRARGPRRQPPLAAAPPPQIKSPCWRCLSSVSRHDPACLAQPAHASLCTPYSSACLLFDWTMLCKCKKLEAPEGGEGQGTEPGGPGSSACQCRLRLSAGASSCASSSAGACASCHPPACAGAAFPLCPPCCAGPCSGWQLSAALWPRPSPCPAGPRAHLLRRRCLAVAASAAPLSAGQP